MRALWTALEVPRTQAIGMANLFTRIGSGRRRLQGGPGPLRLGRAPAVALALTAGQPPNSAIRARMSG